MAPLLVKEVMRLSEVMSTKQFDSWFMKVINIISKFGFAYVLDQPDSPISSEQFLSKIGQQMCFTAVEL